MQGSTPAPLKSPLIIFWMVSSAVNLPICIAAEARLSDFQS
jgi:hypothetical protein